MSDAIIISVISTLGLIIIALINRVSNRVDKYHKEVNGKMGELLITTKALGNAEGKATGKAEERAQGKRKTKNKRI